jgi:DNA-directed RNA polymerase subunit RPC12/RpoP
MASERKGIRSGRIAALALLAHAIGGVKGGPPMPKHLREVLAPRQDDGIHTGDACPKCQSRRVWVSGETLRCRDCGTRFVPDDLPPAEEEADS